MTAKANMTMAKKIGLAYMKTKQPVFYWGQPGIGKSDLIRQIACVQGTDRPIIDIRLLLMDPTDLKGIPYYNPKEGKMLWAPPSCLPDPDGPLANAVLFLDELSAAPPSVQAAAYQLVLDRKVGEYCLPDGVDIFAAGNRESDRGVAFPMPSPLHDRFKHVDIQLSFECWQDWAMETRRSPVVIGFLSSNKNMLNTFDPKKNNGTFATPRSWVTGPCMSLEKDPTLLDKKNHELLRCLVEAAVGEGVASSFMGHLKYNHILPKAIDILEGKVTKLDDRIEISGKYQLAAALAHEVHELGENEITLEKFYPMFTNMCVFAMDNFESEMVVLTFRSFHQSILKVPSLRNFSSDEIDKKVMDPFMKRYRHLIIG